MKTEMSSISFFRRTFTAVYSNWCCSYIGCICSLHQVKLGDTGHICQQTSTLSLYVNHCFLVVSSPSVLCVKGTKESSPTDAAVQRQHPCVLKDTTKYNLPSHLPFCVCHQFYTAELPVALQLQLSGQLAVNHVPTLPRVPQHHAVSNAPLRYY